MALLRFVELALGIAPKRALFDRGFRSVAGRFRQLGDGLRLGSGLPCKVQAPRELDAPVHATSVTPTGTDKGRVPQSMPCEELLARLLRSDRQALRFPMEIIRIRINIGSTIKHFKNDYMNHDLPTRAQPSSSSSSPNSKQPGPNRLRGGKSLQI